MERGPRAGVPALLFLHAFADSWRSYERVLEHLPPSVRAFALTQRGHGDADRPESGYAVEDFAADVTGFMDAVGIGAAVLAGDSGATLTVQRVALDHPERTLGIVLIGAPRSLRDDPRFAAFVARISELRDPIEPGFVHALTERVVSGPVPPAFLEAMAAESLKVPARVWRATAEGLLAAVPPVSTGTIAVPALLLWGTRDDLCPRADQESLLDAIPGARLLAYRGAGHLVHWERPEQVAADVAAFGAAIRLRT